MSKTTLIFNKDAGSRPREDAERAVEILQDLGERPKLVYSETLVQSGEAARVAVSEGCERIIVAGGDGTVNEVAQVLANSPARLAILPRGTANLLSNVLGIPTNLEGACRVAALGRTRQVDMGMCNERYFLLMAGIGLDAEIVGDVNREIKRQLGPWAYVFHGAKRLLRHRVRELKLTWTGGRVKIRSRLLVVGNAKPFGDTRVQVTPEAEMDDGQLDVCVFEHETMFQVGVHFAKVLMRRHVGDRAVVYFKTPSIKVEAYPSAPIQLDGDLFGRTPAEFRIAPRALNLVVP